MLVLARADAGAYPLRVVDIYLDDIVEECRQGVGMLAEQRGVSVTASSPTDVPLRGDEELLRRLLLNLLHNALQHSPAGGTVCIEVTASPQHACVRVHDSGPGIPEADRVRIFDRFVQLDASRRSEGTGLGLTIARWIAEAHDGSLILESSSPEGSTFCATLPLAGSFRPFIVHS
jgi:signal transduction histidine kinase